MCGKIQNSVEDIQLFNKLNPVNFCLELECFVSIILILIRRSEQKDYGICQTYLKGGVGEGIGQLLPDFFISIFLELDRLINEFKENLNLVFVYFLLIYFISRKSKVFIT